MSRSSHQVPIRPATLTHAPSSGPLAGCLFRILWMGVGNVALFVAVITLATSTSPDAVRLADVGMGLLLFALPAVRYVDIVHFGGTMATGAPAGLTEWRSYALRIGAVVLGGLAVGHGYSWWSHS